MSVQETQALDLGRSKPVNMPITKANAVLIESSSASSCEQSLLDTYQKNYEEIGAIGELQLKEDLADAMLESPGIKESGKWGVCDNLIRESRYRILRRYFSLYIYICRLLIVYLFNECNRMDAYVYIIMEILIILFE